MLLRKGVGVGALLTVVAVTRQLRHHTYALGYCLVRLSLRHVFRRLWITCTITPKLSNFHCHHQPNLRIPSLRVDPTDVGFRCQPVEPGNMETVRRFLWDVTQFACDQVGDEDCVWIERIVRFLDKVDFITRVDLVEVGFCVGDAGDETGEDWLDHTGVFGFG